MLSRLIPLLAALVLIACGGQSPVEQNQSPDPRLPVVLILGQSNNSGHGYTPDLDEQEQQPDERWCEWEALGAPWLKQPVTWSDGGPQVRHNPSGAAKLTFFGPDLFLGRTVAEAGHRVAIVKYAVGGMSLGRYWRPSLGLGYPEAIRIYRQAVAALGEAYRPAALVFVGGESDNTTELVGGWRANMDELIETARADLDAPGLPLIYSRISRNMGRGLIAELQAEQDEYAAAHPDARMINTDTFPVKTETQPDGSTIQIHYGSEGQRMLGTSIGEAVAASL